MRISGWSGLFLAVVLLAFGSTVSAEGSPADSNSGERSVAGFDGDGYSDLVVGVHWESVAGQAYAGAVNVICGSGDGLTAAGNQYWDQDSAGVLGDPVQFDYFGRSLTIGDFNGDRFADVAIGISNESVGAERIGAVQVLYGAAGGLSATGNQLWSQQSPNVLDPGEDGDSFGCAVTTGDFNGDGFDDLAVGVCGEDFGSSTNAGAVNILFGSAAGISSLGNTILHQDLTGTADTAELGDVFGSAVVAGDFNGDGFADLAVGVPGEDVGTGSSAGAVHVFSGGAAGFDPEDDWFVHQDVSGMADSAEWLDSFGGSLAVGDFDGDGFADLAIGVGDEGITSGHEGAVHVVYGSVAGLTTAGNQFWHQDVPGMADTAESNDYFGRGLAAGDFDGDGFADLAVGVHNEDVETTQGAGAVHILYGDVGGLGVARNWFFHQDTVGMLDESEEFDHFGTALAVGGFNGDRYADLAIGVPWQAYGGEPRCGAVSVVLGSATGLAVDGNQVWHQSSPGILDACASDELFGAALAALPPTGLFLDDFETGDSTRWSAVIP